ncbi:S8 family serine peptidase [Aquimarina sp. ERC-38]|uniref:S8 family serine peptidase n=1 Tax=Aquimarina sp. ERC-38 TaxID=2949996 RepID=UPI0022480E3E|nr:S8 family serine peptidase [Aquimarina sp. ERC-38]UZO82331.1 S8 family serine peptidase [Aquimarina sp. ERC-38]
MKNFNAKMLLLFCVLWATGMYAQEHYYYYQGKKVPLEVNKEFLFVVTKSQNDIQKSFAKDMPLTSITKTVSDNTAQSLSGSSHIQNANEGLDWTEIKVSDTKITEQGYQTLQKKLDSQKEILFVNPYFFDPSGKKMALTQYFNVQLKNKGDLAILKQFAQKTHTTIVGQNQFMPLWYTLSVTQKEGLNAMQMANAFYESGNFNNAEPSFMLEWGFDTDTTAEKRAATAAFFTADTYYNDQWTLNNTGQNGGTTGIDMNAEDAWNITKGSSAIKVAIIDQGFERDHPDLQTNNFGPGFDTHTSSSPSSVWGRHGTPCAGIIGAVQDNNEGVSGVAPRTSLMSISVRILTSTNLANGINWAWQNGADILSNSWGGGSPSSLINNAINNALDNGRDGLGSVVVFSAGNGNVNGAEYPSNSNPRILCVGAIDRCGVRSGRIDIVPDSCDPWGPTSRPGSSFGTPLDVVSGGTSISATDMQGSAGYNGYANDDYTDSFGGTSAACPFVAGVAALVLAENPCLTNDQVQQIIEASAQKVRTDLYTYSFSAGRPNGTWNNELGYGLVDAEAAVNLAQITTPPGTQSFDLYSQDRPDDTGQEPNNTSSNFYRSQDIWVRQNPDGGTTHQNPEYKEFTPNAVYVKVRNRGTTTSSCAVVKVYFARASTGLTWPTHFINNYAGSLLNGDIIGSVNVPSIPPGGSTIVEIPWFPPNPADYGAGNQAHHFCLTSRIISANDPMANEQNGVSISFNAKNNNNIAWKNVMVYDTVTTDNPFLNLYVRGINRKSEFTNIAFIDRGLDKFDRIEIPFFEVGNIEVEMDEELFKRMLEMGSFKNKGINIIDENRVVLEGASTAFTRVPLRYNETFTLRFKFNVFKKLPKGQQLMLDVVQQNDNKEIEGGETFLITTGGQIDEKDPVKGDVKFTVSPNPNTGLFSVQFPGVSTGKYIISNFSGQVILSDGFKFKKKVEINMQKYKPGMYFIKVYKGKESATQSLFIK